MITELLKVNDKRDFHYEVEVKHQPELGFSTAYYKGTIIADCEFQKLHEPYTDNDGDWEEYEERLAEWKDEVNSNLIRNCEYYFNEQ